METIALAPGYEVSRITKGNWQLSERHGAPLAADEAIEGMRRFVEAGITSFDCADHYIGVEELIGAFRARHPDLARRLKVQTKIVPDRDRLSALSRTEVQALVDRSLRRLGVERLDLVQFHWWDYAVPRTVEVMGWLAEAVRAGKIHLLGTTNFDVPHLGEIVAAGIPVASNQLQYSVVDRRPEHGMVEFARRHGIALQCYGALAGGFLSERWLGQPEPEPPLANRSLVKYRLVLDEFGPWALFQELLAALQAIARKHDASIAAVAARAVLDRPGVATVILGARTASHLDDLLAVDRLRLDEEDHARILAVTGRGGGPLGDCYDLERVPGGRHAGIMWTNQNAGGAGAR